MGKHTVQINEDLCIGCGLCTKTCVACNLEIQNEKAKKKIEECLLCGQCVAICPKEAIAISGYKQTLVKNNKEIHLNPEEVLDTIRFRRSIRNFKNKEVPKEIIDQILEAGRLSHTAKNMQDVSFIVLDKEKDILEKMAVNVFKKIKPLANLFSKMTRQNKINDTFFFFKAPLVIVILAKDKTNGILAAQNMEFVAEANGLGTLYSGFFTMAANYSFKIKRKLAIPKKKKVAMTLVLGYPSIKYIRSAPRKNLDVKYM